MTRRACSSALPTVSAAMRLRLATQYANTAAAATAVTAKFMTYTKYRPIWVLNRFCGSGFGVRGWWVLVRGFWVRRSGTRVPAGTRRGEPEPRTQNREPGTPYQNPEPGT